MRQTKENTEQVKDRILEKAAEEFAQKGYAGANLQSIAEAAGVSRGPLYYHFKNKEELFSATIHKLIQEQKESYERVLSKEAPILDILREEYLQCLSYCNTLLQTMDAEPELQALPEYQEFSCWLYTRKRQVFAAAKARGEFRKDSDPNRLVTFLYVFYSGVIQIRRHKSGATELFDKPMLEHSVEAYLDIVQAMYLA